MQFTDLFFLLFSLLPSDLHTMLGRAHHLHFFHNSLKFPSPKPFFRDSHLCEPRGTLTVKSSGLSQPMTSSLSLIYSVFLTGSLPCLLGTCSQICLISLSASHQSLFPLFKCGFSRSSHCLPNSCSSLDSRSHWRIWKEASGALAGSCVRAVFLHSARHTRYGVQKIDFKIKQSVHAGFALGLHSYT